MANSIGPERVRTAFFACVFGLTLSAGAHAGDCSLAKHDVELAQEKIASSANDEAETLLRQSIAACPNYDAYEQLAELLALSDQNRDKVEAIDAFVAAHARAPSPKARAQTLYQYAALLYRENDPQNAYPLIKKAHASDPTRRDITHFESIIETQVNNPNGEQLTRALRFSLYKPLIAGITETTGGGSEVHATAGTVHATAGTVHATAGTGGSPSINVPINFKNNSVVLDDQTAQHLPVLAAALASKDFAGRHFTFVGHTDTRGDDAYNVYLSLQRAKAVSDGVIALEPSLQGRISLEGHGAREPIDPGTTEKAMRANRRLQVFSE